MLDAAVACFWQHGYEATTIRDLTSCMGLSAPSLYNAFGDKRALFAKALERYCQTRTYALLAKIEASNDASQIIPVLFAEVIARTMGDKSRRGCFLINSALDVAPHDAVQRRVITKHLREVRAFFMRGLLSSRGPSARPGHATIEADADHLLAVLIGIRVLARSRPERELLEGIVHSALSSLDLLSGSPDSSRKT